jgi:hypothetical protein
MHLLTDKAFNATTSTNVAIAPPAWEQHPCLILPFTAHPGMDGEKAATIHTTSSTVLPSTPPRRTRRQPPCPGFLGLGIIRSLSTRLSHVPTRPRAPSVNRGTTPVRRPQGIARSPQDPGSFTVPSPRHPRDDRHSQMHVATATSTAPTAPSPPRHRLRVFRTSRSPLDSIKEKADGSPNKGNKTDVFSTSEIKSNTPFSFFLETWDRLPLSQLVTPTQALRCKEIQYSSPLPLDVGPSLPEPG